MTLLGAFRQLIGRPASQLPVQRVRQKPSRSGASQDDAAAWLAARKSGRLDIPADVHDRAAWDRYWLAQLEVGQMEQGFNDMMASDSTFLPELDRRAARTVLCVGNGFSSESWVLALHGFDVTVLDVSSVPRTAFCGMVKDTTHQIHRLGGVMVCDEASIAFQPTVPIDREACPPMHQAEGRLPKGGGSLTYVTGDLMNADLCPGPFDVIVERRTVQLFPEREQPTALERLAARLTPRALLVSHQHHGGWRPNEPRSHFADEWAADHGFMIDRGSAHTNARVARLVFTTG